MLKYAQEIRESLRKSEKWAKVSTICFASAILLPIIGFAQWLDFRAAEINLRTYSFYVTIVIVAVEISILLVWRYSVRMEHKIDNQLLDYFQKNIEIKVPDRGDWVARKVVQQFVNQKVNEVKRARADAFAKEKQLLKPKEFTPEAAQAAIALANEGHAGVESLKIECDDLITLVKRYRFDPSGSQ